MKALLDKFSNTQNRIEDITLTKSDKISDVYFCFFNGIKAVIKEDKLCAKKIGLNREREVSLLNAISHSCSCPNIIFNDFNAGIIIWEYIEGTEVESKLILNKDFLIRLGRKVKNIHITDTTTLSSYNFLDFIEHYKNIIKDSKFAVDINNLISKLYNSDTQLTLCHNDLTKPNILVGDTISFIDWEYASLNDPHYDIATVFQAYNLNANQMIKKINQVKVELKNELSGIKDKPYVVFHDAYQYFETSFGLNAVGSVALEGDIASSPKQISFIKDKIVKLKASCVFQEPQFDSRLVKIVVEGTNAKIGTLDPLGVNIKSGENFYLQLLKNMAKSLKDCLG